jgi:hypothetical protein
MKRYLLAALVVFNILFAGIVSAHPPRLGEQKYPDVMAVNVRDRGENHFDFDVTISSEYDTPQRYADAFRVMSSDGEVFGVRTLWHDHEGEQPFTRDLYGVNIMQGIKHVIVQARDQKYGYGGKTMTVALPGRQ